MSKDDPLQIAFQKARKDFWESGKTSDGFVIHAAQYMRPHGITVITDEQREALDDLRDFTANNAMKPMELFAKALAVVNAFEKSTMEKLLEKFDPEKHRHDLTFEREPETGAEILHEYYIDGILTALPLVDTDSLSHELIGSQPKNIHELRDEMRAVARGERKPSPMKTISCMEMRDRLLAKLGKPRDDK